MAPNVFASDIFSLASIATAQSSAVIFWKISNHNDSNGWGTVVAHMQHYLEKLFYWLVLIRKVSSFHRFDYISSELEKNFDFGDYFSYMSLFLWYSALGYVLEENKMFEIQE